MNIVKFVIFFAIGVICLSCDRNKTVEDKISLICVKDLDTLHIKLTNKSGDTIFIPSQFIGTFNIDSDSIFLEVVDKPSYNTTYYYRYSKIFPFAVYTAKKIDGEVFDTIIKVTSQTYYYNQFRVPPFVPINPGATFTGSVVFNIPEKANVVMAVYYFKSFDNWMKKKDNYDLDDFQKFDSANAHHVSSVILSRYFLK